MAPIRTLFATGSAEPSRAVLPDGLRARYDGNLSFPPAPVERPYLIANFVSTLDGVVSFNLPGQSEGSQISDSNEEDRFIMGLLRASADAVLVGSGTLQAVGPSGSWLPESVYPAAKDLYRNYRTEVLRKPEYPLVVIVTGTGGLDLSSAVFHTPRTRVLILTTEQGKQRLSQSGSECTRLSRGEGALHGRDPHLSFRHPYVAQTGSRSGVAASRSRPDTLWRISRRRVHR